MPSKSTCQALHSGDRLAVVVALASQACETCIELRSCQQPLLQAAFAVAAVTSIVFLRLCCGARLCTEARLLPTTSWYVWMQTESARFQSVLRICKLHVSILQFVQKSWNRRRMRCHASWSSITAARANSVGTVVRFRPQETLPQPLL